MGKSQGLGGVREQGRGRGGEGGLPGDPLSAGLPRAKPRWAGLGSGCESPPLGGPRHLSVTAGPCREIPWGAPSIVQGRAWELWWGGGEAKARLVPLEPNSVPAPPDPKSPNLLFLLCSYLRGDPPIHPTLRPGTPLHRPKVPQVLPQPHITSGHIRPFAQTLKSPSIFQTCPLSWLPSAPSNGLLGPPLLGLTLPSQSPPAAPSSLSTAISHPPWLPSALSVKP